MSQLSMSSFAFRQNNRISVLCDSLSRWAQTEPYQELGEGKRWGCVMLCTQGGGEFLAPCLTLSGIKAGTWRCTVSSESPCSCAHSAWLLGSSVRSESLCKFLSLLEWPVLLLTASDGRCCLSAKDCGMGVGMPSVARKLKYVP